MRGILLACLIIILIAFIFPPWIIHYNGEGAFPREYGFILSPPDAAYYSLDLKILIMEILIIVAFTSVVLLLLKKLR
jgi:hypothetical protein